MNFNIPEMQEKIAKEAEARAERFRNYLTDITQKDNELSQLLSKAGKRVQEENDAAMREQVELAIKHAEEKAREEHAKKYGIQEDDDQRVALRKIVRSLSEEEKKEYFV